MYNDPMKLDGRIALITGAGKRVGRTISLELARRGADIAVHYRSSDKEARATAEEVRQIGRRAELFRADLSQPDEIETMFGRLRETFGRLDVLVNSAGIYHHTPIETLTAAQWDTLIAVNARGPALCIRYAAELMDTDGAIVNITDIAAEKTWAGFPAYCASKAALLAVTKSSAKALAGRNIRVNAVAPGAILWQENNPEEDRRREQVLKQIPMKRVGTPEDIAAAVAFLIDNDYITAQTLRVDGGWHMG